MAIFKCIKEEKTMVGWLVRKGMIFLGSKLAKNIAISIVEVLVKRSNNKWDDEVLATLKNKEF